MPLKCTQFDGLKVEWGMRNFVDPPYDDVEPWARKALEEFNNGKLSVMLIPYRPTTGYWGDLMFPNCTDVVQFTERIRFKGYTQTCPVPIAL